MKPFHVPYKSTYTCNEQRQASTYRPYRSEGKVCLLLSPSQSMGSLISPIVPVIDFNNKDLKQGTSAWASAMKQACHGLQEFGCFVALYDEVPPELDDAIFQAADELFDLPTEIKSQNVSNKPYHGYVGQLSIIPLHEGLGIDNVTDPEEVGNFTKLMWPNGNDHFRYLANRPFASFYANFPPESCAFMTRLTNKLVLLSDKRGRVLLFHESGGARSHGGEDDF